MPKIGDLMRFKIFFAFAAIFLSFIKPYFGRFKRFKTFFGVPCKPIR